jgi:large subunit ribosomal protein L10
LAITKEKKAQLYAGYLEALKGAQGVVVAEYRGMSMKNLNAVRAALRPVNSSFAVVKSTIFRIALRQSGLAAPEDVLSGPVAVAIAYGDLSKMTKVLLAQMKDQPLLIGKGAIMGTTVFKAAQLEALSTLPTLEEARASLIGTLISPASQLVGLLAQPAQGLAAILQAYADKHQEGEAA